MRTIEGGEWCLYSTAQIQCHTFGFGNMEDVSHEGIHCLILETKTCMWNGSQTLYLANYLQLQVSVMLHLYQFSNNWLHHFTTNLNGIVLKRQYYWLPLPGFCFRSRYKLWLLSYGESCRMWYKGGYFVSYSIASEELGSMKILFQFFF